MGFGATDHAVSRRPAAFAFAKIRKKRRYGGRSLSICPFAGSAVPSKDRNACLSLPISRRPTRTQSRGRTGMEVNPLVFETSASTDSAIWATPYIIACFRGANIERFLLNAQIFCYFFCFLGGRLCPTLLFPGLLLLYAASERGSVCVLPTFWMGLFLQCCCCINGKPF